MSAPSRRFTVPGPAGLLELAVDEPVEAPRGVALLLHPLPTHGGTMDNKVVQTLVRAALQLGYRAVRLNFRGVGRSEGAFDHGVGEVEDALAAVASQRESGLPFLLAGFSFGAFVATQVAERLAAEATPVDRLALVGLAASRFPASRVPEHTLVLHGEHDDVVPLAAVLDWARPQALPVTVLPGVGHFFHGQLTLLKRLLVQALSS